MVRDLKATNVSLGTPMISAKSIVLLAFLCSSRKDDPRSNVLHDHVRGVSMLALVTNHLDTPEPSHVDKFKFIITNLRQSKL